MAPLMGQAEFAAPGYRSRLLSVRAQNLRGARSTLRLQVKQPAIRQGGHDTPAARLHQVKTILLKRPLACVTA